MPSTMRYCISVKLSPSGKRKLEGLCCTAVHSGSLARCLSFSPVLSPKSHSSRSDCASAVSPVAQGLGVRRAMVKGPMLDGIVSLWEPVDGPAVGIPYVVFAGNVGQTDSLARVVSTLAD